MWIPILVGLALGLAALIVAAFLRERRYRLLFSDVHLRALAEAVAAARTGPATTFAGIGLEWRALKLHTALVITPRDRLAPEATRFLMGVLTAIVGRSPTAAIILDGKRTALVLPGEVPTATATEPAEAAADAWRTAGVEAMRSLAVVPGALAAWE